MRAIMTTREKMLSTKETAGRLDAGESSIRLWCDQGRFPNAQKIGSVWVIPESDLSGFQKQRRGPKPKLATKKKGKK
jgi:predicted DNA-binding transcriptional regulator AlpA